MFAWLARMVPSPDIGRHLLREEGEVIVEEIAHHWFAYVRPVAWAVLGLVSLVAVLVVDLRLGWFFFLAGVVLLLWAGYRALVVHMDRFVVTNMRVFRIHGVLSQSLATMPLRRILDISTHKPFVGRLLGFGHFVFESAAQEQGLREINTVGNVDERDLEIQRVVQRAGLRGRAS